MDAYTPYSKNKAVICAFFLGFIGLHNFVWGNKVHGIIKLILTVAGFTLFNKDHALGAYAINMALFVWIFADMISIRSGSFCQSTNGSPATKISTFFMVVFVLIIGGSIFKSLTQEIKEFRIKDSGIELTTYSYLSAYQKDAFRARTTFEDVRFTLEGTVKSITPKGSKGTEVEFAIPYGLERGNFGIMLLFPAKETQSLMQVNPGDVIKANCIGRRPIMGFSMADKCMLKK